jgi:AbrB family looped-hinge helix DNA binding protein
MLEVTLSEHYQVDIPKEIRDSLHLKAGQKFIVELKGDLIAFVPKPSIKSFRGILKGANTDNIRDRTERL